MMKRELQILRSLNSQARELLVEIQRHSGRIDRGQEADAAQAAADLAPRIRQMQVAVGSLAPLPLRLSPGAGDTEPKPETDVPPDTESP